MFKTLHQGEMRKKNFTGKSSDLSTVGQDLGIRLAT